MTTAINTDLRGVAMENLRFTWEIYKRGIVVSNYVLIFKRNLGIFHGNCIGMVFCKNCGFQILRGLDHCVVCKRKVGK